MTATAPFAFHIDTPASWRPVEPDFEISGWIYPGAENECLDVRVRVDGRLQYGIYGLDRPDTHAAFGKDLKSLRTGFMQRVNVWKHARTLTLEYLDGQSRWQEFFRTPLDTSALPDSAVRNKPILRAALLYQSLYQLYRYSHRESWFTVCRRADEILRDVLSLNSDVPAGAQFIGQIENPGYWINVNYDKFRITGWAFAVGRDIRQLSATTGVHTENRLIFPKDRPDVAAHRADHPNALKSGYYGLVDVRSDAPSPVNLKFFAEMPDGQRHLAFSRRMHLDRHDDHAGAIPVYRPRYFYKCVAALLRGAALRRFVFDSWPECKAEIRRLQTHLASTLGRGQIAAKLPAALTRRRDLDPYTRWRHHNRLTPRLTALLQQDANRTVAAGAPVISVVVPAYNTPEKYLRELIDCMTRQLYPRWELCIADDASPQPHVRRMLEEAARKDPRIKPVFRQENGHISRATNSAIEAATGDFVALVDHDDVLPADALLHVAQAIQAHPSAGMIYTDEDKIDDTGRHFDPHFKGAWNPEMALTHNYTHHLTVIRRDVVNKVGGLRHEFTGAQDIDLFLRCAEQMAPRDILHVPFVCYHWRAHAESTASRGDQKSYLFDAARNAIAEATVRRGLRASPMLPAFAKHYALCLHQLQWSPDVLRENPVTIVIPTKNRADLLRTCLDSIARTTPKESVRVIIVDDQSDDPETLAFLRELPARTDLVCGVLTAPPAHNGFDYSRLVNLGTAQATTPLVLHLNNDVSAIAPGWLEDMAGWLSVPGVGVVGAKLLYPDHTINHGGISVARKDGLAHTLFEREPADDLGLFFLPHAARDVAAVTGACFLTRTELYRQLNGFDETAFKVAYNDVDYCLRCQEAGLRVVYTPQAALTHLGSASRGNTYAEREHVAYIERHGRYRDPYLSESLIFPPASPQLDPYSNRYAQTARPFHALILTHNLNFEGAPIFIFELARYLSEQPGLRVTVASPHEGPLRARFEQAGLKVEVWDASSLSSAATPEGFQAALKTFAASRNWQDVDVFICNTLVTFWAVHLATHLGKSSALYIHESNPVKKFFTATLSPAMQDVAEEALRMATRVIFTAQATRDLFEENNHNDNFRLLPSWIDIARIEQFCAKHDRRSLRLKHGLDPDATIVVNIGSICERKGQHIYVSGIARLHKEGLPASLQGKVQFAMVGARPGLYMETLMQDIQLMGLQDVKIFDETSEIYDFYRLADILVCTSFEESFPRVLLEAMAFGVRIVSTNVNGIPEMLTHTDEAYLVPAGDPFKLADALRRALEDHSAGDNKMISMAYARASRSYHKDRALPRHLLVCREAWLG